MPAVSSVLLASEDEKTDAGTGTPRYVEWDSRNGTHDILTALFTMYIHT